MGGTCITWGSTLTNKLRKDTVRLVTCCGEPEFIRVALRPAEDFRSALTMRKSVQR